MEGLRRISFAAAILAVAIVGCSKEPMAADYKPVDPYAGMSGQQKVDAIRNDPKISSMARSQMISDAQKAAGLPVTGQ